MTDWTRPEPGPIGDRLRDGDRARILWAAVMQDALRCAEGTAACVTYEEQQAARVWLRDVEAAGPGTVRWIAEMQGMTPQPLRPPVLRALRPRERKCRPSDAEILARCAAGWRTRDFVRHYGRSSGAIQDWLKRVGRAAPRGRRAA